MVSQFRITIITNGSDHDFQPLVLGFGVQELHISADRVALLLRLTLTAAQVNSTDTNTVGSHAQTVSLRGRSHSPLLYSSGRPHGR